MRASGAAIISNEGTYLAHFNYYHRPGYRINFRLMPNTEGLRGLGSSPPLSSYGSPVALQEQYQNGCIVQCMCSSLYAYSFCLAFSGADMTLF